MKIRNTLILLALLVGLVGLNPTGAQSNDNDDPTWQFSVKFACGQVRQEGGGPVGRVTVNSEHGYGLDSDPDPVTPGVYETAINVHNPSLTETVRGAPNIYPNTPSYYRWFSMSFRKKALLLYPPAGDDKKYGTAEPGAAVSEPGAAVSQPTATPMDQIDQFEQPQPPGPWVRPGDLPPDWGLEIDCADIRAVLLGQRMNSCPMEARCEPGGGDPRAWADFIKGYVVIEHQDRLPLDVTALYTGYITSNGCQKGGGGVSVACNGTPAGFSEQVETIDPKKIDAGGNDDD
jgi:hypothetical protein